MLMSVLMMVDVLRLRVERMMEMYPFVLPSRLVGRGPFFITMLRRLCKVSYRVVGCD